MEERIACQKLMTGIANLEVSALVKKGNGQGKHIGNTNQEEYEAYNISSDKWKYNYVTVSGPYAMYKFMT